MKNNYQYKVLQFQIAGGEDLNAGLTLLREELLREEIQELEDAIKADDRVEILDALCDIKYINDGTANLQGTINDDTWQYDNFGSFVPVEVVWVVLKRARFEYVEDINMYVFDLIYLFNFTLENFKEALDRVHESNMSKFCNTEQEAIESVISYKDKGIEVYSKQNGDKWVIYRLSDNKILKSKYYHPVKLEDLI